MCKFQRFNRLNKYFINFFSLDFDNDEEDQPIIQPISVQEEIKEPKPVIPTHRVTWDFLQEDSLHQVIINFLDDPKEFIIKRSDRSEQEEKLNNLIDEFETTDDCKVMKDPKAGCNCLIPLDDGKSRGRIIGFGTDEEGDYIRVFSCDIGRVSEYDYTEVFETSKEITECMPSTTIQGSFAGIVPMDGETYDKKSITEIWNLLDDAQATGKLYAKVVGSKGNLEWLPGMYRYDLVLAAKSNDGVMKLLNHEMVAKGLAKWDTAAGPNLQQLTAEQFQNEFDNKSDSESDEQTPEQWEEFVGTYKHQAPANDDQQLKAFEEMFKMFGDTLDEEDKFEFLSMLGATTNEISLIRQLDKNKLRQSKPAPLKAIEPKPEEIIHDPSEKLLKAIKVPHKTSNDDYLINKAPPSQVLWQQSHTIVILSIHVGDTPDYHLEVHQSHLIYAQFPSAEEQPRLTIINFFGIIKPNLVSHQIRGLNLIIRLPKLCPGLSWSRLTIEKDKFPHIKYNLNTMNPLDDDFIPIRPNEKNKDDYDSDDDIDSDAQVDTDNELSMDDDQSD